MPHRGGEALARSPLSRFWPAAKTLARFAVCDANGWCQRAGLNRRPRAYESPALPLSYSGLSRCSLVQYLNPASTLSTPVLGTNRNRFGPERGRRGCQGTREAAFTTGGSLCSARRIRSPKIDSRVSGDRTRDGCVRPRTLGEHRSAVRPHPALPLRSRQGLDPPLQPPGFPPDAIQRDADLGVILTVIVLGVFAGAIRASIRKHGEPLPLRIHAPRHRGIDAGDCPAHQGQVPFLTGGAGWHSTRAGPLRIRQDAAPESGRD